MAMTSKTTKMTKGHAALNGKVVLGMVIACIVVGPLFFYINLFEPHLLWGCAGMAALIGVWGIQRSKARKEILPLLAVPVTEPTCIGCSRSDGLTLANCQFHCIDIEKLPAEYEFFDGVINEYSHARSGMLSICNGCVVRRSKRELLSIALSLIGFIALSYLPHISSFPVLDVLIRGTVAYVLVITAYYYLQMVCPWRSWSEEIGLGIAEKEIQIDHPRWEVRGDNWYRRHLDSKPIQPVLDDDDEFLPIAMSLVAAHVIAASIWATLSLFGIAPWFQAFKLAG